MSSEQEEWRQEAEKLFLMSKEIQNQVVRLHRRIAKNPNLSEAEREAGLAHALALAKHLKELAKQAEKKPD
jgi:hypothetical protein